MVHRHLQEVLAKNVLDEMVPEHRLAKNEVISGKQEPVYLNILRKGPTVFGDVGHGAF